MISRKKILSRSRDILDDSYEKEDGVWFHVDKLFKDHIMEILRKWDQIDDEIWGKIICMERNRRIAKAYSRGHVLTINGSHDGFDGYKIGLNGFDNPMRDALTKTVKSHIGKGVRLKLDDTGNIIIRRMSNCDVFIRGWDRESNSLSTDIVELSGELEFERSLKLFDMKKFQSNVAKELRSSYPDRKKLESQCISIISFGNDSSDILSLPCFVMIINIVAIDMLKTRVPSVLPDNRTNNKITLTRFAPSFDDEDDDVDLDLDKEDEIYSSSKTDSTGSSGGGRVIMKGKPTSIMTQSRNGNSSGNSSNNSKGNNGSSKIPKMPPPSNSFTSFSNENGVINSNKNTNGKSKSSSQQKAQPPKLPPRDFSRKLLPRLPTPDYESPSTSGETGGDVIKGRKARSKNNNNNNHSSNGSSQLQKQAVNASMTLLLDSNSNRMDDPYYCGLRAKVSNFKESKRRGRSTGRDGTRVVVGGIPGMNSCENQEIENRSSSLFRTGFSFGGIKHRILRSHHQSSNNNNNKDNQTSSSSSSPPVSGSASSSSSFSTNNTNTPPYSSSSIPSSANALLAKNSNAGSRTTLPSFFWRRSQSTTHLDFDKNSFYGSLYPRSLELYECVSGDLTSSNTQTSSSSS